MTPFVFVTWFKSMGIFIKRNIKEGGCGVIKDKLTNEMSKKIGVMMKIYIKNVIDVSKKWGANQKIYK